MGHVKVMCFGKTPLVMRELAMLLLGAGGVWRCAPGRGRSLCQGPEQSAAASVTGDSAGVGGDVRTVKGSSVTGLYKPLKGFCLLLRLNMGT